MIVDGPHFTNTATVGQIEITWVSVPNAVVFLAEVAVALMVCDPPSFRRKAGIGLLLSSVGINVGMVKDPFGLNGNNKNPRKREFTGTFVNNNCQTGKNA